MRQLDEGETFVGTVAVCRSESWCQSGGAGSRSAARSQRRSSASRRSTSTSSGVTSTGWSIRTSPRVGEQRARGLLDTSVLIDLDSIDPDLLPVESAISALSMAELAAGPHASRDTVERARRQDRLQRAEVVFDPIRFDADAARACGLGVRTRRCQRTQGARTTRSRPSHRGDRRRPSDGAVHAQCRRRALPRRARRGRRCLIVRGRRRAGRSCQWRCEPTRGLPAGTAARQEDRFSVAPAGSW